jgi:hypothetical protein
MLCMYIKVFKLLKANLIISPPLITRRYTLITRNVVGCVLRRKMVLSLDDDKRGCRPSISINAIYDSYLLTIT